MVNKKVRMTALISLGFLTFCSLLVNKANTVKAEDKVTETASYTDMIVRTALNNGEMYTGGKLADYAIVHGKVSTKIINKFTTCIGNASSWTGSLGTTSDNAFATNGQINTLNDDGVIAKVTAKEDIEININKEKDGGWTQVCTLSIYKGDSLGISELKVVELGDPSPVSDFNFTYDLLKGETLYYEFRMPWGGSHRNMQELPIFTFTQKEVIKKATVVESYWSKTLENVNSVNGGYYNAIIVDYSVKHGNVKENIIKNYETLSASNFTSADGSTASNWQNVTSKNDGVILAVKANKYVVLDISLAHFLNNGTSSILQGWPENANINVYKQTKNGLETILSYTCGKSVNISDVSKNVVLETNEILYYEFIFEWDARNMQNFLPYFKATEIMHNMSHVYKKDSTCTSVGNIEYYYCDECNKYYSDPKGEKEINKDILEIPMVAHEYQDTLSYNEEGHFYKCNNCDAYKSFASHNLTWVIDEEASEEKTGLKHQECDTCKYQTSLNTIIDVLPHTHKMSYVEEVKSTCSKDGNVGYYVCSKCNKTFKDEKGSIEITNVVIKASHKYGKLVEEIKATCSKEGTKAHYQCSSCHEYFNINKGKVSKDELVIEKNPHELVHHEGLKATCTSKGYEAYDTCKNCDYTTYKEIDKLPHDYSNEWTINEDYHYNVCKYCNEASGYLKHNYEWIVDEEATCIKFGIQHQECKDCHNKINMGVTIAKKNHTIVEDKEVLATCSKTGLSKGSHCSVCNEVIVKQIVINKTSHTIVIDKKIEATCKQEGLSEGSHCSVCDEVIVKQEVIAKKDHSYVWIIDKEATCTQEGIKHEECLNCKTKNNENTTINKKEHVEVIDDEVLATCENTGLSKGSHCLICNEVIKKQEEIAKKEHQLKEVIDKDSTCTTEGLKHDECRVCHSKFNETAIAKKEHEVVEDKAIEATCTKTGLSKGTHCKKCGNVLQAQEVIAKKPHTEVIDKAVEATCSSTGLTIGSHCSECNEILVKQEVVAKKEHTFTEWTKDANNNKEVRECSVCHKIETRALRSNGCKGSVAASIITLINCLGLLIILRKKYL